MIHFFTGTPGSGKSLHMAMIIDKSLRKGKNVIANFEINETFFERFNKKHPGKGGSFIYVSNRELLTDIDFLYSYSRNFHKKDRKGHSMENQTLLVLDECQDLFDPRSCSRENLLKFCTFTREHRLYGYTIYLISQDDTAIDRQIRFMIGYEYIHRCINRFGLFVYEQRWYGIKPDGIKIKSKMFHGKRKYRGFYKGERNGLA